MQWKTVVRAYTVFAALVALDLILISLSGPFRGALGRVYGAAGMAARVTPDLLLLGCLAWFLMENRRGTAPPLRAALIYSRVFSTLAIAALIPWVGMFFAALTPISALYFSAILWVPKGYLVALAVVLAFVIVNTRIAALVARMLREQRAPGGMKP